ncbi:RNA-dependent ATPase, partial [Lignoscripta atroalba]|nr:RNA-dependent ATPase [Lignoscripta atroalba]
MATATNSLLSEKDANGLRSKKRKVGDSVGAIENGGEDAPKSKRTKEERREQKRLKKLHQEEKAEPLEGIETNGDVQVEVMDKAAAKAARKAEKARLKEAKKDGIGEIGTTEKDEVAGKAGRKADKAKIKRDRREKESTEGQERVATNGHISPPENSPPSVSDYQEHPDLSALPQTTIDTFLSTNFITITDPMSSKPLRPVISFSQLPPSAISTKPSPFSSFKNPTPIQSAAWPFLLSGRDVIGIAETGSGKTLAFGVPCIRYITSLPPHRKSQTTKTSPARAVIISPTRELAVQIHDQIVQLAIPAGLQTVCVYGGVPKDTQRLALKSAHIIVATPGRLNDLINEGAANLSNVGYLVLDEADRMLDKGFEDEIRKIIATTPSPSSSSSSSKPGRQTLMFTATWPPSVRELASTFMRSPVKISIGENNPTGELRANTRIVQKVEVVDPRSKETRLLQLLKQYQSPTGGASRNDRILVFCLYKKEATRVENFLRGKGLRVAGIHGDLSQGQRTHSLEAFKRDGGTPLLVATDVAARGLDIPDVKVVINVTFPLTVEDYVHRIGRTGRAGSTGLSITLFTEHDKALSGPLINVLKAAGQEVPADLLKFGTTVKKKPHEAY